MKNIFKYFLTLIFSAVYLNPGYSALPEQFFYIASAENAGGIIELNTKTYTPALITTSSNVRDFSLVISPDGKFLYTCNPEVNAMTVIRLSDHSIVRIIENIGDFPYALAITPDGRFVYVANQHGDNVSIIDTATNTEITNNATRITVGEQPHAIVIRPQGDVAYVLNNVSHSISVINLSDNLVNKTIPITAINIQGIAFSPDGAFAYVVSYTDGNITPVNVATGAEVLPATTIVYKTWSITISPDGKTAYLGMDANATLHVVNLSSTFPPKYISTITGFSDEIVKPVFSPDGKKLYNYLRDGTVETVQTATNAIITAATMDVGPSLRGEGAITPSVPLVQLHSYRTDSFTDSDVYNTVSWSQPVSAFPLHYEIYRDKALTQLAKSIPCGVPGNCQQSYEDHNLIRHKTYEYYVAAKNDYGIVSIGSASITTG